MVRTKLTRASGLQRRMLIMVAVGGLALILGLHRSAWAEVAKEVDMLLCMAADVSESVTPQDYRLQKTGHARAIRQEAVIQAIEGGPLGRVAATYVEWAKQDQQFIAVPWQIIDGREAAERFATRIDNAPPPFWLSNPVRNTSIAEAIQFCLRQFDAAPVTAVRRVIDLSSDGTHNIGASLPHSRESAVAAGAVINALVIVNSNNPYDYATHENPEGGLPNYFERNVIAGDGAFIQVADGYESFARMIRRKFLLELSQLR